MHDDGRNDVTDILKRPSSLGDEGGVDFAARVAALAAERRERSGVRLDGGGEELSFAHEELRVTVEELEQQTEELSRITAELEAEHARYRDLFYDAPDPYFVTTTNGAIREANPAAARLLNVPPAFLRDKVLLHFVARQDARVFRDALRSLASKPDRVALNVRIRPRKGTGVLAVALAAKPVRARGATVLLRWLARPVRESSVLAAIEDLRQNTERIAASVDVLRSRSADGAAREAALTMLERIAADQRKVVDALSAPPPAAPASSPSSNPSPALPSAGSPPEPRPRR